MTSYTITLSEAELAVVALALGRMLSPKPVAERKPAGVKRAPALKPPKLGSKFEPTAKRWAAAVEEPAKWRDGLAGRVAHEMGYGTPSRVLAAWGIAE